MTLVAVDLTQVKRTAKQIVADLCHVHAKRKNLVISRRQFLLRWGKLRIELADTPEYRQLVRFIMARDKVCRICGGDAYQAHHIEPVSRVPAKALDRRNMIVVCKTHHDFIHSRPAPTHRAHHINSRTDPTHPTTQLTSPRSE